MSDSKSVSEQPLEEFFTRFVELGFSYKPTSSAHKNFANLCKVSGWARNSGEHRNARAGFNDALVQQFNAIYGTDGNDLIAWQNLCCVIGIEPVPDDMKECKRVVRDAHVNIVDLIEIVRTRNPVRRFNSLDELARYTKQTSKFIPKENAYQGGLLKELLREIINPDSYFGRRCNGSEKRKRRKARKQAGSG
ncbi:hypothetical protein PAXRUDRAFT_143929 [Paxillus rubicundulus Ve08.2h10]|uniref:Uncharacterized protein n=1 Tax=Paxillus rubicundulus Ve08.2h10 TaxID=930991 RepID=A0A0D0DPN8_9AGAM|nr:hypothetical protein PAXRUDRAFT_143929 [Paxillus rubicundulus Ve08.2h10]